MSSKPSSDLGAFVRDASRRLADDAGQLWGSAAAPRWILAGSDAWWLSEAVDGATAYGDLWQLPPDPALGVGSTTVEWRNRTWAMVDCISSPPTVRLMLHEAFHAFTQPRAWDWLTPAVDGDDSLAMPQSRAALRVELNAWARALSSDDHDDITAANTVRQWRLGVLAAEERRRQDYLDLWEGMAEYSAWKWTDAATTEVAELAVAGPQAASWHRSFCYTTGPVLGWALDRLHPEWRSEVAEAGSLTALLDEAAGRRPRSLPGYLDQLDYSHTLSGETAAYQQQVTSDHLLRQRFSSLVWLPLRGSIQFDPREVRSWDLGTFYRILSVQTEGLQLSAGEGAIVTNDWQWVGLPAPAPPGENATLLEGPGWSLTIADPAMAADITWGPVPPAD